MNIKVVMGVAGLLAVTLLLGCGPQGPKLVPAEGVLTMAGSALDGASVTVLYPDGNAAQDVTHDGGKFALTYMGKLGAVPGTKLKVTVMKQESAYTPVTPPAGATGGATSSGGPSDEQMRKALQGSTDQMKKVSDEKNIGKKPGGAKNLIDYKYSSPTTSGLELTIPESGAKNLEIKIP